MIRLAVFLLGVGLACFVGLLAQAWFGGAAVLPSYLAAWLFILSAPLGALPLVAAHDLAAWRPTSVSVALRRLLIAMPIAALLAIPILANWRSLYPVAAVGFASVWKAPAFGLGRSVGYLILWVVLALLFARPPDVSRPSRRGLAVFTLALYLVFGTLAAIDWAGALDPGLNSSELGLLVLVAQLGIALSIAALIAARGRRVLPASLAARMAILLGVWLFLQFTQYLVVWSADLPDEILWYLHRDNPFGQAAVLAALAASLLAAILLTWQPTRRTVAVAAGLILIIHCAEFFWLVVPDGRGEFRFVLSDGLALVGLAGVLAGATLLGRPFLPAAETPADEAPQGQDIRPRRLAGLSSAIGGIALLARNRSRRSDQSRQDRTSAIGRGHPETEPSRDALHEGYEPEDANARDIATVMVVSVGIIAAAIVGLFLMEGYFHAQDRTTALLTLQQRATIVPPGPPLQAEPLRDLAALRSRELSKLRNYRWLTPDHTTGRIPIDRAMALTVGKSLDPTP